MLKRLAFALTTFGLALAALPLAAQEKKPALDVLKGPATAKLGTMAKIEVPVGFIFLDGKTTRALKKRGGDPVSGDEVGFLGNTNKDWAVWFEFQSIGYVKDDDKNQLDAAKLLESYRRGTAEGNKSREAAGRPPIEIIGWDQEPKYDETTHNLTWCLRAKSAGEEFVNFKTKLLGRKGVMDVVLACSPQDLAQVKPEFYSLLATHKFETGESYAEYRPGDKIAKYGLGALVVGGAAVGAAKLGLLGPVLVFFKKLWYLVVAALVAIANFFKRLFGRLTGKKDEARLED